MQLENAHSILISESRFDSCTTGDYPDANRKDSLQRGGALVIGNRWSTQMMEDSVVVNIILEKSIFINNRVFHTFEGEKTIFLNYTFCDILFQFINIFKIYNHLSIFFLIHQIKVTLEL